MSKLTKYAGSARQAADRIALKAKQKAARKLEGEAYKDYKKAAKELDKATKKFGKENPGKTKPTKELQKKYDDMFMARGKFYEKQAQSEINQITGKPSVARSKLDRSKTLQAKRAKAKDKEKKALRKKDPAFRQAKKDLVKMGLAVTGGTGVAAGVGKLVDDALTKKPQKKAGGGLARGARAGKKAAEAIERRVKAKRQSENPPSARRDMANKGKRSKSFDKKLEKDLRSGLGAGTVLAGAAIVTREGRKREAERMKKDKQRINKIRGIGKAQKGFGKAMNGRG